MEALLPLMEIVYSMTERKEIYKENVSVAEKIFSIYELHTDIIVKGSRDVQFGHKINIGSGKSNLILTCDIVNGNPKDSELYRPAIMKFKKYYGKAPNSSATDGGYASKDNLQFSIKTGITNIVFNKIKGGMQNIAKNKWVETRLKKWRSGIEAVISNLKRGFEIRRCNWKGFAHYRQKVFWSVIGYNIRVMTSALLSATTL